MRVARRTLLAVALSHCYSGFVPAQEAGASLPRLISASKPSVVLVGTYSELDSPRFTFRGTGFCASNGNIILTNAHVLPDSQNLQQGTALAVQAWDVTKGWHLRATKLLRVDRRHDLAVLMIEGAPLPVLSISDESIAIEGRDVALIGFPIGGVLGFSHVTHRGIVSAVTKMALPALTAQSLDVRAIRSLRLGDDSILQLDITAYPGNSGGPVIDIGTGQVVGLVSMVLLKATRESALSQPTGITYAIPAAFIRAILGDE